jgi:hypothetical protein
MDSPAAVSRPINGSGIVRRPSLTPATSAVPYRSSFSSSGPESRPSDSRVPTRSPLRSPDRSPERPPELGQERYSPDRSQESISERSSQRAPTDRSDRSPDRSGPERQTSPRGVGGDTSDFRGLPRIRSAASPTTPVAGGSATSPRGPAVSPSLSAYSPDGSRLPPPPLAAAASTPPDLGSDDLRPTRGRDSEGGPAARGSEVYPVYKDRISFMISRGRSAGRDASLQSCVGPSRPVPALPGPAALLGPSAGGRDD